MDLKEVSKEIKELLEKRRQEIELTFIEDEHIYFMKDINGVIRNDFPSVSKVIKCFHEHFDTEGKSLAMAKGDLYEQSRLLAEWKSAGDYSTNMGSMVHYELEKDTISRNGDYKEVRQPIFECDESQISKGDSMIIAGKKFLHLMEERGAVLLDTEIVLGDPELEYTGQPDKMWLIMNKEKNGFGFVTTDWKTNKKKNFIAQPYTKKMYPPFNSYDNTALSHYYIQLPLYAKLLLKMLKGTKYDNLKLFGCIVVLLKDDATFEEYRVPMDIINTVLTMDVKKYLNK